MSFDSVRLPDDVEKGAQGGPRFKTSVLMTSSGAEQRNANWSRQRCEYQIGYGIQSKTDAAAVIAFYYARQGRLRGFRFKDWADFESDDAPGETLGVGTASPGTTTFQLVKNYTSGGQTYVRKITRPVLGTLHVYWDGVEKLSGWSCNYETGVITFSPAPGLGVIVSAVFEFDVPVRFDTDIMSIQSETAYAIAIPQLTLVELRE